MVTNRHTAVGLMKNSIVAALTFATLCIAVAPVLAAESGSTPAIISLLLADSSNFGDDVAFDSYSTEFDITIPTPTRISAVGTDSAAMIFRVPGAGDDDPATEHTYKIYISTTKDFTPSVSNLVKTVTESTIYSSLGYEAAVYIATIDGLSPGTLYYCKVTRETPTTTPVLIMWTSFEPYYSCSYWTYADSLWEASCRMHDGNDFTITQTFDSSYEIEATYWDYDNSKTYHAVRSKDPTYGHYRVEYSIYDRIKYSFGIVEDGDNEVSYTVITWNCDEIYGVGTYGMCAVGSYLFKHPPNDAEAELIKFIALTEITYVGPCYVINSGKSGAEQELFNYLQHVIAHPVISINLEFDSVFAYDGYPAP